MQSIYKDNHIKWYKRNAQVFHSKTTGKEYKIFCNVNCKTPMWFTSLTVTSVGRNT